MISCWKLLWDLEEVEILKETGLMIKKKDEDLKVESMERDHTFYYTFYFFESLFQLSKMDCN